MGAYINSVSEINSILVLYLLASMRKTVLTVILKKKIKMCFTWSKAHFAFLQLASHVYLSSRLTMEEVVLSADVLFLKEKVSNTLVMINVTIY